MPPSPSSLTGFAAWVAVAFAVIGTALFFTWVYLQDAPNFWEHDIEDWKIPRGGPESAYVQQVLMGASLALAALAAGTSEWLVGLRRWQWPYQYTKLLRRKITRLEAVLWFLILGSIIYWFTYAEVSELQWIYGPPSNYSYHYGSYSYENANSSYSYGGNGSYAYDGGEDHAADAAGPHGPPFGPHGPHGPHGHHHHGPPHGFGPQGAKWVQALSEASRQAGLISMMPICLLGVPLARSSAFWRLAGLSYEEAVNFHRWLGHLAVLLTTFHTLGYLVVWTQPVVEFTIGKTAGGLAGIWHELFSEHGVAGLNPFCDNTPPSEFGGLTYNPECCGVSNLAGLIAWAAGIVLWTASLVRVRRSRYLLFIQTHQLHYVFFGFTCAHWSYSLFYMLPSATFYAADIVLRWHGTYACKYATARVHGQDEGKEPTMVTLLLPVPASAADATVVASACPFLQSNKDADGSIMPLPTTLAETDSDNSSEHAAENTTNIQPSFATDPWAGTTCYLQARGLSPLSHIGGWSHPFTVAGSVAFSDITQGAKRALLVHIAPERNWTLRLARAASKAGGGEDVRMSDVSVVSPLPAPPHLEHLAHSVMMGKPLLLIGAGSGVTPGVALIRMLASRTLPATARVRLVVIIRSMHVGEALDGYMLPTGPDGATGLPWLTTEIHMTRAVTGAEDAEDPPPSTQSATGQHGFQGGFRLSAAGDGKLKAIAAPYRLAKNMPNLIGDGGAHLSRRVVTDELATLLGAFVGFMSVTWPLIGDAADHPAPWSYKPTAVSGMGALLLGWICAMGGAWLALLLCDLYAVCTTAAGDHAQPTTEMPSEEAAGASSLIVPLVSNGKRPCMKARLEAFARPGEIEAGEVLMAAGGPEALFATMEEALPAHVHVQRLTHPM